MEQALEQIEINRESSEYLKSGKQTQITPEMVEMANNITGNAVEKCKAFALKSSGMTNKGFSPEIFRKRTAEQIIRDDFVTGCTDCALVFVTLARACGLPAKYVETVDENWLKGNEENVTGHQFAQVYDEGRGKWFWVDPAWGKVDILNPTSEGKVVYKEGLDSWDIGFRDGKSMETALYAFREDWKKKEKYL